MGQFPTTTEGGHGQNDIGHGQFDLMSCWCLDPGSSPQEGQVQAQGAEGRQWEDEAWCEWTCSRASRETSGQSPRRWGWRTQALSRGMGGPCVLYLFTSHVSLILLETVFSLFPLGSFLLTCFQFTYSSSVSHMLLNPFVAFLLSIVLFFRSRDYILLKNFFLGRF